MEQFLLDAAAQTVAGVDEEHYYIIRGAMDIFLNSYKR